MRAAPVAARAAQPQAAPTLPDRIWDHARRNPDGVYVRAIGSGGETVITWSDLRDRASAYARAFASAGVGRGDVVLIFLPHSDALFAPYFGAMALGAAPSFMPVPSVKQDPDVYWTSHIKLFERIQPKVVLTDGKHRAQMAESFEAREGTVFLTLDDVAMDGWQGFAPAVDLDDVALLQHSSGTTGLKKGVALSHRAINAQLDAYGASLDLTDADVVASWLPLYHDMGLIACTLLPAYFGIPVVSIDPFFWLAKPRSLFDAIEERKGTLAWMPNFAFQHLARTTPPRRLGAKDLGSLRAIINCSEVCQAPTFASFAETFGDYGLDASHLQVCYAAAETVFAITQTRLGEPVATLTVDAVALTERRVAPVASDAAAAKTLLSCGVEIDGLTVEVVDEAGVALADGEIGEIAVSGTSLFDGYYRLPEQTEKKLRDGRYFTNDLGFRHAGEIYVLGRKDDVIVVNGKNFMAQDLEAVANRIAGLKPGRNVALGVYNDRAGSTEVCMVAERDPDAEGFDDEGIGQALRQALMNEADAAVADIRIVEPSWLVKTTSGKISREANLHKYAALISEDS